MARMAPPERRSESAPAARAGCRAGGHGRIGGVGRLRRTLADDGPVGAQAGKPDGTYTLHEAYQGKPDSQPWSVSDAATPAYTAPGWKAGDKAAWEEQLRQRNQAQNDYLR